MPDGKLYRPDLKLGIEGTDLEQSDGRKASTQLHTPDMKRQPPSQSIMISVSGYFLDSPARKIDFKHQDYLANKSYSQELVPTALTRLLQEP